MEYQVQTHTFVAPSGRTYTIREQNGQDEEVLTNIGEIKKFMNLNNFLQGIIMSTSEKQGKLTLQEVMDLPILDRNCIFLQSRIFSIGEEVEFSYRWPDLQEPENGEKYREIEYIQDLNEYLFDDYSARDTITEEELLAKPKAIPFYPDYKQGFLVFDLKSGKKIRFKLADGNSELFLMKVPDNEKTRNTDLFMRNLELNVEGKWERVGNFSLFSTKDMREIRKYVRDYDPTCDLTSYIEDPGRPGESTEIPIMSVASFFFPEEDV